MISVSLAARLLFDASPRAQAHCVSNYTGCRCAAVSNTSYVYADA